MRPQPDLRSRPEQLPEEELQRPLEVRQRDPLTHAEPLHLMKKETMGGIHLVPAIAPTRRDHLHRRLPLIQHPDLHRGRLGPQ